ncbi:unnamed protein product, partial [Rotaria magnacalcarata]
GNHLSNSIKCPVIKEFRADLTKKLFSNKPAILRHNNNNNNNQENQNYIHNTIDYPLLPLSQRPPTNNTSVMNKLDEVLIGMAKLNESFERIAKKQYELEQFINHKNEQDEYLLNKVEQLRLSNNETKENMIKNEKLIKNLILPTLELISKFLYHSNLKANGVDDADFKCQIETKRALLDLVLTGDNPNGGVVIMVRGELKCTRIDCNLPNVCVIDIIEGTNETPLRVIAVYATEITERNGSTPRSIAFWSRAKKCMKSASSSLHGFMLNDGTVIKDGPKMCEEACKHYEEFFSESEIFRPHPYTDSPDLQWENFDEEIPLCTTEEVIDIVNSRKKKKSIDAHGLSNFTFNFLPLSYWSLLVEIFNHSFSEGMMPDRWKDSRMLLLAKKDPICNPGLTRPISLLDIFLKVNEKLFQTRFMNIVNRRGLLPDTQSGFRPKFRLQTRVLLFFEHISSLMANSSPVETIFVDFRSAFDQLWFLGCIGKLKRMGIPRKYLIWIENWLMNRRAFIEIKGERSKWFRIRKGGPQGSIFTPLLFITYHSDLTETLNCCLSHHFADDLAAIMAGGIGLKYSLQCLELEKKLSSFFEDLEYYCTLTAQPINYNKTQALFSARAIGYPDIALKCGNNKIEWCYDPENNAQSTSKSCDGQFISFERLHINSAEKSSIQLLRIAGICLAFPVFSTLYGEPTAGLE